MYGVYGGEEGSGRVHSARRGRAARAEEPGAAHAGIKVSGKQEA